MNETKPWRERETVDVAEAADILGMHPQTLKKKIDDGDIPGAFKIGTRRKIATASLRALLGEGEHE